jgi:hypothetical protein
MGNVPQTDDDELESKVVETTEHNPISMPQTNAYLFT